MIEILNNQNENFLKSIKELKKQIGKQNQKETRNTTPEMTKAEIMNISEKSMANLLKGNFKEFKDKKGMYMILNNKKVYTYVEGKRDSNTKIKNINLPILRNDGEGLTTGSVSISIKDGNKYYGVYYEPGHKIYKGELKRGQGICNEGFIPKNYEQRKNR